MRKKSCNVTIIIPVKNEENNIERCLKAIGRLDWGKGEVEVILADGGSKDRTVFLARKLGAKIVENKKGTVAPGRNVAFRKVRGDLIAFTDADCLVDKNWLKNCLKYFQDRRVAGVGGANLTSSNASDFEKAVGWVFDQGFFSAGSLHGRVMKKVVGVDSLPGCNSIYKASVLKKVMPQDESLLTCDETEMNYRIKDLGYKLLYTPDVFVWHCRRSTAKKLYRQIYRYAIGRLQLGKKREKGMNLVHIVVGFCLPIFLLVNIILMRLGRGYVCLFYGAIIFGLFILFLKSVVNNKKIKIGFLSVLSVLIIAVSWSLGYMRELIFPIKDVRGK